MNGSNRGVEGREAAGIRAKLRSGGLETHYRKAGAGAPVLLLGGAEGPSPVAQQLLERLSCHFRVIRPDPPRAVVDPGTDPPRGSAVAIPVAAWLRGVIDGLGLDGCALLAEPPFSLSAIWFAFTDPHRVARLVVLVPERVDSGLPVQDVGRAMEGTGQAVLLVRVDSASGRALLPESTLTRITTFLQQCVG